LSRALRRCVLSIVGLSAQGLTPEALARIVAIGLVLGVFPIFWCPTILCTAAAVGLRLNLPAIHLLNQLTTPLQLALLVPFSRIGGLILGHDSWTLRTAVADAVTGWCCVAVPFGILLYLALLCVLRVSSRARLPIPEAASPSL
jgi:uncharacterized protein (DUF2062 family)